MNMQAFPPFYCLYFFCYKRYFVKCFQKKQFPWNSMEFLSTKRDPNSYDLYNSYEIPVFQRGPNAFAKTLQNDNSPTYGVKF